MNSWAGAVLAAAGAGRRFGSPKQYLKLGGKPLIHHGLEALGGVEDVRKIVVVVAQADLALVRDLVEEWTHSKDAGKAAARVSAGDLSLDVAPGGERRQDSVRCGLQMLRGHVTWGLIHDAARPLVRSRDVSRVLDAARKHGAAVLGTPVTDSVKRVRDGGIVEELPRQEIWTVQTPQAASVEALLEAYDRAGGTEFTDEASALRALGVRVVVVEGPRENLKITRPGDDLLAEYLLEGRSGDPWTPEEKGRCCMFRVGLGFDSHRLSPGRKLVLGGVEVESPVGEVAHSDGDVLLHALCDAIYGALGKGDIGEHFPDSDARWKGQASRTFLEHAAGLAKGEGYSLVNADLTIVLEKPKLSPYKKKIAENIRKLLRPFWQLAEGSVSIKAKTAEGMDSVGRGELISAQAVVLLCTG